MMEGFGVHTFRLVNAAGEGNSSSFTGSRCSGMQSTLWDEAREDLQAADPDYHRRDLWEAIDSG